MARLCCSCDRRSAALCDFTLFLSTIFANRTKKPAIAPSSRYIQILIPFPNPVPPEIIDTVNQIEPCGATPGSQRLYLELVQARLGHAFGDDYDQGENGGPIKPVAIFNFQAFDESWKRNYDGGWGLWNIARSPKEVLCTTSAGGICPTVSKLGYFPEHVGNTDPNVTVDPDNVWNSFINVFWFAPPNPWYSFYAFGFPYDRQKQPAFFGSFGPGKGQLTLRPNTAIYEDEASGAPNLWVDASLNPTSYTVIDAAFYVENPRLAGQAIKFSGKTVSNTLGINPATGFQYFAQAFVKAFPSDFSYSETRTIPLTQGANFDVELDLSSRPDLTIIQYGFELIGPHTSPAIASNMGSVVIEVPTVTPVKKN